MKSSLCLLLLATSAGAQTIESAVVATGFDRPVHLTSPPQDASRLFVNEQHTGRIRIIDSGVVLSAPFLDLGVALLDRIRTVGFEQGLLGLAFHPQYASNGLFYVSYSARARGIVDDNWFVIEEFSVSASDQGTADAASGRIVLGLAQSFIDHYAGMLRFDSAGMLLVAKGDGSTADDPQNNGQDLTTLNGALLRIDVDGADEFPANVLRNYAIPPDNPFVGTSFRPEIWAYGLRNPWGFSIDSQNGNTWIADVGKNAREEINFEPAGPGGANYGWRCMEGSVCTGLSGCKCDSASLALPVLEIPHTDGRCAVIGGFVYRGQRIPCLRGHYFYADFCTGRVWSFRKSADTPLTDHVERTTQLGLVATT